MKKKDIALCLFISAIAISTGVAKDISNRETIEKETTKVILVFNSVHTGNKWIIDPLSVWPAWRIREIRYRGNYSRLVSERYYFISWKEMIINFSCDSYKYKEDWMYEFINLPFTDY